MWPIGLGNTRILTDYAQKSPQTLQSTACGHVLVSAMFPVPQITRKLTPCVFPDFNSCARDLFNNLQMKLQAVDCRVHKEIQLISWVKTKSHILNFYLIDSSQLTTRTATLRSPKLFKQLQHVTEKNYLEVRAWNLKQLIIYILLQPLMCQINHGKKQARKNQAQSTYGIRAITSS